MNGRRPLVSIGLPVYNGERFLPAALDSLLRQTFWDFELLIADYASTDRTGGICQELARFDGRIRYTRSAHQPPALAGLERLAGLAAGQYFKWAAPDDLHAPDLLNKSVTALERHSGAVLCHSAVRIIDHRGVIVGHDDDRLSGTASAAASERLAGVLLTDHRCQALFGLMRTNVLRETLRSESVGDLPLLAALALRGRFASITDPLRLRRRSVQDNGLARDCGEGGGAAGGPPEGAAARAKLVLECTKVVRRAPLAWEDKRACYAVLLHWGTATGRKALSRPDLLRAARFVTRAVRRRAAI